MNEIQCKPVPYEFATFDSGRVQSYYGHMMNIDHCKLTGVMSGQEYRITTQALLSIDSDAPRLNKTISVSIAGMHRVDLRISSVKSWKNRPIEDYLPTAMLLYRAIVLQDIQMDQQQIDHCNHMMSRFGIWQQADIFPLAGPDSHLDPELVEGRMFTATVQALHTLNWFINEGHIQYEIMCEEFEVQS